MALRIFATALVASTLVLAACVAPAIAADKRSNWVVVQTFADAQPPACTLRYAAPVDGPTLSIQTRGASKQQQAGIYMVLGGLPAIVSDKTGTIGGVSVALGDFELTDTSAEWKKGKAGKANSSSLTLRLDDATGPLAIRLALAPSTTIVVNRDGTPQAFSFEHTGAAAAIAALAQCLAAHNAGK